MFREKLFFNFSFIRCSFIATLLRFVPVISAISSYDFSINNNSDGSGYDDQGGFRTDPKPIRWDYFEDADRKKLY